ncbi:malectin domain-containing carbohydrate-binding protein [Niabella aurantiaca]|uniref:malectin domain-containing carbohydrate-binding protein n=1 Tax=Niabella aurantiaca TaxID=379900 RepID=UPI00036EA302|nr:malectin domain-containing carbohydrate-binding protein [Niabella aurantiaca]
MKNRNDKKTVDHSREALTVPCDVSRRWFLKHLGIGITGSVIFKSGYGLWATPHPAVSFVDHSAATGKLHYYAHDAVLDAQGVIAPWYKQPNGQCDFRVRIAAETLKRYPWTNKENAIAAYPHYLFSGKWKINDAGEISPQDPGDWMNGDLGQRSVNVLKGMVDYYRYTGDAAAISHMTYMGDFLVDHSLTPANHAWPGFPISAPVKGKAYYDANPEGMIQLDISATMGHALLKAFQVTGNLRWLKAAKHWGDLFAAKCNKTPGKNPWPRYANPEHAFTVENERNRQWRKDPRFNRQTGGVTMVMTFLDELIRLGYTGKNNDLVKARNAGLAYVKGVLLPEWTREDSFALHFWDWANTVQNCTTTADVSIYMLNNKADFPNWKNDVRNILTLFLNRTSANPASVGDVYSGAWAYPESSHCCKTSLWYAPLTLAPVFLRYGVEAGDDRMRELGYRQMILQTYDGRENGITEDLIDGGVYVNGTWFNIAHPWPLFWILNSIGWAPEQLGASKENHLVYSSATVANIAYGKDHIAFTTFDAPGNTRAVLRLSFVPHTITADGKKLPLRNDLEANGFTVKQLPNGDAIITVRHDGSKNIIIKGVDQQQVLAGSRIQWDDHWEKQRDPSSFQGTIMVTAVKDAVFEARFSGNQIRLIGRFDQYGGIADVFIDNEKQLVPIDFWGPSARHRQVLYYKNGLENDDHTIKVVARGAANPYSKGKRLYIDQVQAAAGAKTFNYPTATGPAGAQRMIFGYAGRKDYQDTAGHFWRPGTEVVTRVGPMVDTVATCWFVQPVKERIAATNDPGLYRYGYHAPEFWVNLTVGPGEYKLRLKFAATRGLGDRKNSFDILVNGKMVAERFDIISRAGKVNTATDLVFNNIKPQNGIIRVKLRANDPENGKALLQALEISPQKLFKNNPGKSV